MNSKERIVSVSIVCILLALVFFLYNRGLSPNLEVDKYQARIIELQNQIQLMETGMLPLQKLVEEYKIQIIELDSITRQKDLQISKLKEDVENISNRVDNMGYNDFTRFFSSRYNVSLSTHSNSPVNN